MTAYQNIHRQFKELNQQEQIILLEELTKIVATSTTKKNRAKIGQKNIMDLEGLGKEIWLSIDVQKYIEEERNSWDG